MKLRLTSITLAIAMMVTLSAGAVAAPQGQTAGAAGVVAAVLQISDTLNNNQVGLVNLNNSLNNLTALNNVLNNSPILSNNDIDVTVGDINILNNVQVTALNNFLNNNNIDIDDVIAIAVLSGGEIVVFA